MAEIVISQITSSSPQYQQVWDLREAVLRQPIGLSLKNEDLSRDHVDTILIAEYEDRVIACLMLTDKGDNMLQLRQMAVTEEWQGKGVGRDLVIAAEKRAKEQGYSKIILHARKTATGFYKGLGYGISGDEFSEVGIPHFCMEKTL